MNNRQRLIREQVIKTLDEGLLRNIGRGIADVIGFSPTEHGEIGGHRQDTFLATRKPVYDKTGRVRAIRDPDIPPSPGAYKPNPFLSPEQHRQDTRQLGREKWKQVAANPGIVGLVKRAMGRLSPAQQEDRAVSQSVAERRRRQDMGERPEDFGGRSIR